MLARSCDNTTFISYSSLPGLLCACVLRRPLAHVRVRQINTSRAEALPGVRTVLSADNAAQIHWYKDSYVFDHTARSIGDEIAAVAADTEEIAEDALRLIEVEYEPLPFVVDLAAALQPHAPMLRASGNLAGEPKVYQRGDPRSGLGEADVVVDEVYTTQTALHNCIEPHGCAATWDGDRLML